jgi:hypothetical protein
MVSRMEWVKPSTWENSWANLFLGDINTGAWPPVWGIPQSETVKYGREYRGTRDLTGEAQQKLFTRHRRRLTSTKPQPSDNNKNLTMGPRFVLDTKIDWSSYRQRPAKAESRG